MIALVVCLVAMLQAVPAPLEPAPAAGRAQLTGVVGYAVPELGAGYLAMRLPKGTHVRICGPAGCANGVVNDYGPSKRKHPGRIADLSWPMFGRVCGSHEQGLCTATATLVEVPRTLPATDTEG